MELISHHTGFDMEKWLKQSKNIRIKCLEKYGKLGCECLASATPVDSGTTASSWSYDIRDNKNGSEIIYNNTNINKGVNIAIILQYGHGTRNGGYVQGIDYINPALEKVFSDFANEAWEEMTKING